MGAEDAAVAVVAVSFLGPQHHRPCPVAEQHAGGAVGPVDDTRKRLGPDDQRGFRLAQPDEVVGDAQPVDEAGTDRLHVEGGAAGHAERGLDPGGGGGKGLVRGRGGENDDVEIGGR